MRRIIKLMIREGYDPNEQSINRDQRHGQFENQEEIMRGERNSPSNRAAVCS
jgi:hypothetical protein